MAAAFSQLLAASSLCFTVAQGISYSPAASAPLASGISQVLGSSFTGLGIEPSNLFSFTGHDNPNELSINLLQHLADYSGAPPHLRIGGNTGDYMVWNASYDAFYLGTNPNSISTAASPSDASMFGPGYLEALDRFPTGTPITFGLNMAYDESDYIDRICEAAAAVVDGLNNTKLYSFEIGNEPDLYLQSWNGQRTGTWDGQTYTTEWLDRAGAVYRNVLKSRGIASQFFEAAQTASTISTTFTIDDLVDNGITAEVNGSKYLASWNQHDYFYFVGVSTYDITLNHMMQLSNTESQFTYWASEISGALSDTAYPYNLREMAGIGPTGLANVSDTFGAALWTFNFYLYAATLNISSVGMHMTDNSYGSPWQPIFINEKNPNVRPSYYAMAAMTQLIGSGNSTRVAPLSASNDYVRSYAAYNDDKLSSIVIINAQQANTSNTDKASLNFTLSLPDYSGKTLYLSYLTADGSDATSNTTWNGISFEQDSLGTANSIEDSSGQTIDIDSNGGATISVRNSQAIIAQIGSRLGGTNGTSTTSNSSSTKTSGAQASGSGSSSPVSTSSSSDSAASASASASASSSGASQSSGSTLLTEKTFLFSVVLSTVFVFGSLF